MFFKKKDERNPLPKPGMFVVGIVSNTPAFGYFVCLGPTMARYDLPMNEEDDELHDIRLELNELLGSLVIATGMHSNMPTVTLLNPKIGVCTTYSRELADTFNLC